MAARGIHQGGPHPGLDFNTYRAELHDHAARGNTVGLTLETERKASFKKDPSVKAVRRAFAKDGISFDPPSVKYSAMHSAQPLVPHRRGWKTPDAYVTVRTMQAEIPPFAGEATRAGGAGAPVTVSTTHFKFPNGRNRTALTVSHSPEHLTPSQAELMASVDARLRFAKNAKRSGIVRMQRTAPMKSLLPPQAPAESATR